MPKLKVFRTTIGFHDAYVAAPSMAAALRAWGANTDLFAMGAAELVTDPALTARPLSEPGLVIKQSRGTAVDHLAASPTTLAGSKSGRPSSRRQPKPLPSRAKLDAADKTLANAEAIYDRASKKLDTEAAKLRDRKMTLQREHQAKTKALQEARDALKETYDRDVEAWRNDSD